MKLKSLTQDAVPGGARKCVSAGAVLPTPPSTPPVLRAPLCGPFHAGSLLVVCGLVLSLPVTPRVPEPHSHTAQQSAKQPLFLTPSLLPREALVLTVMEFTVSQCFLHEARKNATAAAVAPMCLGFCEPAIRLVWPFPPLPPSWKERRGSKQAVMYVLISLKMVEKDRPGSHPNSTQVFLG